MSWRAAPTRGAQEPAQPALQNARLLPAGAWSLLGLLMLGPLAFGAVHTWAWAAMAAGTGLVGLLWAFACLRRRLLRVVWSPLLVPLLAAAAMAGAQYCAGLTMDAVATREAAIKLLACAMIFFLSLQFFADARLGRRAALAIAIYAFAMALFAIIQFFASPGLLYGVIRPRWGGYVFGPYVSHNNYAGLMEMLIPIAVGLVLGMRPRHPARPLALFAVLTCVVSVFLSGSRGGVAALLVEFALFAGGLLRLRSRERNGALLAAFALMVAAGAAFFWLDPGGVWQRWRQLAGSQELTAGDRSRMSADTLRMARAHLARGVGLGAFAAAYPAYQSIVTDDVIDYAHNDYLQFVAEGGIAAALLTAVSVPLFLLSALRELRRRRPPAAWLAAGAAVGVCGMLVHSAVDFNLHIPANAAWLAFCAALALAPASAGCARDALAAGELG